MKSNIIFFTTLTVLLFTFSSCEKDDVSNNINSENHFSNLYDMEFDEESNISISTTSIHGNVTGIQVIGQFTEDRKGLKSVKSFKINEENVPFVKDRYIGNFPDNRLGVESIIDEVAGKNIVINVENDFGSSITDFTIYNPNPIVFSLEQEHRNISRKKGLTLKWIPDNSIYREDNLVGINVVYRGIDGADSQQLDNIGLTKSTQDNGELFISEEELSIFPENSKIDINMIRGNYAVVNHADDIETLIITHSIDSHGGIIVD